MRGVPPMFHTIIYPTDIVSKCFFAGDESK